MSGTRFQVGTPAMRGSGGILAGAILLIIIAYMVVTVLFAGFLVRDAFFHYPSEFEKITISAVIAVVGTVLTALSSLYTANRQSAATQQVDTLRAKLNGDLDTMKAQSNILWSG